MSDNLKARLKELAIWSEKQGSRLHPLLLNDALARIEALEHERNDFERELTGAIIERDMALLKNDRLKQEIWNAAIETAAGALDFLQPKINENSQTSYELAQGRTVVLGQARIRALKKT